MLQVKQVTIAHKKDLRTLLEGFSFVLNPGDKAVIIGSEGNGKSTLLKWLYDEDLVADYVEVSGERICKGERIGYLPQELDPKDYEKSVYAYLCEAPMFMEQAPDVLNQLTIDLNLPIGFLYNDQIMKTLSGGERIKVQMARILIESPTVLLLDEPSNDLDIPTLEWLEHLIKVTKQAVVFVSHDETLIEATANVIIHIEQIHKKTKTRHAIARLTFDQYRTQRDATMDSQKRHALNDRREEKARQEKLRKLSEKVTHDLKGNSRQDPEEGRLLKKKMKAVKSMEKRFEREAKEQTLMPETESTIMIKFPDVLSIPSGKVVIDMTLKALNAPTELGESKPPLATNIALRIKGCEKVCIVGRNGVGKTTLIRHIAQELLQRDDINAAYMPQSYEEQLDLDQTPIDYLEHTGDKEAITKVRTYLGSMQYTADEMSRPIRELSGGQKAKIFMLKMNLSKANVLILDEPTRNFSPLSNPEIRGVLATFKGAIISVSHDRKFIEEVCDTVYELTESGLILNEKQ